MLTYNSQIIDKDWHWLAGIFEGEGTAGLRLNKGRWPNSPRRAYLYAAVYQTNLEMLEEVQRIAGRGKIYVQQKETDTHKQQWAWYVACKNAREFLNDLLPYIRSPHKARQVIEALDEDKLARAAGAEIRRTTLAKNSAERWRKYHAQISRE